MQLIKVIIFLYSLIFSGTCVVDNNNTNGFRKHGKAPMVAIYTGHIEGKNQSQHIAYSIDEGLTWTKYQNNPVLDLGRKGKAIATQINFWMMKSAWK